MSRRVAAAATLLGLFTAACKLPRALQDYGIVPEFTLTSQTGQPFGNRDLAGKVWVANFIFTTCQGPCPRMTSHMRRIQDATGANVKLVSFSVDPDNDTPTALSAYAKGFGADLSRWSFLTGDKKVLNSLGKDTFKLQGVGEGVDHSTRFVLIDAKGRIRGYYSLAEDGVVSKIAKDAAALQKEQG